MACKYYVMYSYGYYADGEYGFKVFDTKEEAIQCIKQLINSGRITNIDNQITFVEGKEFKLTPIEIVKDIEIT